MSQSSYSRVGLAPLFLRFSMVSIIIAGLLITVACQREVPIPFRIEVRTNQGDPVHEAEVKIAGQSVGYTDAKGVMDIKHPVVQDSQVSVEITKSSDSYYFAPHVDSINLARTKERPVNIKAVLYFVPKPKPVQATDTNVTTAESVASSEQQPDTSAASEPTTPQEIKAESPVAVVSPQVDQVTPSTESAPKEVNTLADMAGQNAQPVPVKKVMVTVHVFSGKSPVPAADVKFIGPTGEDEDTPKCKTNVRGRCAIQLDEGSSWSLNVSKADYIPETSELMVTEGKKIIRVQLGKGQTIEIAAFGRGVTTTRSLPGVQINIDGVPAGRTDQSGNFVHRFKPFKRENGAKISPKIKVEMIPPKGFTPDLGIVELPATGSGKIIRHFVGSLAKIPVTIIDDPLITTSTIEPELINRVRRAVDSAIDRKVFAKRIFTRATRIHKNPDFRVRRVITEGPESLQVELLIVDVKGIVVAAAKEMLPREIDDNSELKQNIDALVTRMVRSVPFHGVVVDVSPGQVRAELPGQLATVLEPGDRFDLFSNVLDSRNRISKIANIGAAVVTGAERPAGIQQETGSSGATIALNLEGVGKKQRVEIGDVLVLRPMGADPADKVARIATRADERKQNKNEARKKLTKSPDKSDSPAAIAPSIMVRARSSDDPRGLANANVYFDDVWIGTTNSNGVLYLSERLVGKKGSVTASKAGWNTVVVKAQVPAKGQLEVALEAEPSRLRLDSVPSGASVYLDGKLAGKTPLDTPMNGSGSFVKLEIEGAEGYKRQSMVLEIESGTLDLSGQRAVVLEEDIVSRARGIADAGKVSEAVGLLTGVPENHSDYLLSRHLAGELALGKLNDPENAAVYFAAVTSTPEVRDFIDKRYVGSHINQGIALHLIAEKNSTTNPRLAAENFNRAATILEKASRYTRFLPKKDFEESVRNLEYFRALSLHRQWLLTKDDAALTSANRAWREYLNDAVTTKAPNKQTKVLADNARVYLKQTQAGMTQQ